MHSHKTCACAWISALFLSAFKLKQWNVHWQMNEYNHKMENYPSVKANESLLQQESMLKILCSMLKIQVIKEYVLYDSIYVKYL